MIEIRGSIDDLVFYNLNGIPVVRKKSGFNKDAYANNPKYAKVRENSSEFGHCSKSGKMIRLALHQYLSECGDSYMYQKFAQAMTRIKDMDTQSARGNRKVPVGLGVAGAEVLLQQFVFGAIPNLMGLAIRNEELFGTEIRLANPTDFDEIILVTLAPNFENYHCEISEETQNIKPKQTTYSFAKNLEQEILLYFLVLKKDGKIIAMGFV